MEKASKVMYTIANIFNYLVAVAMIVFIVLDVLGLAHVPNFEEFANAPFLVAYIISFLVAILLIFMIRKAKAKGTSKGWDVLFIILGVLDYNPFLILGGIFGLLARR